MKNPSDKVPAGCDNCSVAVLFLRMFIGGVMLMHILGELHDYDILVGTYPSILGMGGPTSLAAVAITEGLLAVMIILGFGTRLASVAMTVAQASALIQAAMEGEITMDASKLHFIYLGIYVALTISGGGAYAFNIPRMSDKMS